MPVCGGGGGGDFIHGVEVVAKVVVVVELAEQLQLGSSPSMAGPIKLCCQWKMMQAAGIMNKALRTVNPTITMARVRNSLAVSKLQI